MYKSREKKRKPLKCDRSDTTRSQADQKNICETVLRKTSKPIMKNILRKIKGKESKGILNIKWYIGEYSKNG